MSFKFKFGRSAQRIATLIVLMFTVSRLAVAQDTVGVLKGIAPYIDGGLEQYQAGLYLERGASSEIVSPAQVEQMAFKISRSRQSSKRWYRQLVQRVVINADPDVLAESAEALNVFSPMLLQPFYEGDVVSIRRLEGGAELAVNDVVLGEVLNSQVFELYLSAWMGPVPPSTEFQEALLLQPVSADQKAQFETLPDSEEAEQRLAAWVEALSAEDDAVSVAAAPTRTQARSAAAPAAATVATTVALNVAEPEVPKVEATPEPKPTPTPTPKPKVVATPKPTPTPQLIEEEPEEEELDSAALIAAMTQYRRLLHVHPSRYVKYPVRSQNRREEGVVQLAVTIARDGNVLDVTVNNSSSHKRLDRAALEAVVEASPFPELPELVAGRSWNLFCQSRSSCNSRRARSVRHKKAPLGAFF